MKQNNPMISKETLESLSEYLSEYLTHSQIDELFHLMKYEYICPKDTYNKRQRIYNTFAASLNKNNKNITLLYNTLFSLAHPSKFSTQEEQDEFLFYINKLLAHDGIKLSYENGERKLHRIHKAININDAIAKANDLRGIIELRKLHPKILEYCKEELLKENYFHAVLEASKSIYKSIQSKTNLRQDGYKLIDSAFNTNNPYLIINNLKTPSEINEQIGFANLLKGITSMFRNTTAHEAKIEWEITKEDAIDIFTILSFAHWKLDHCQVVRKE